MLKQLTESIKAQVSTHVLNQEAITELALAAFFAGGHIVLVGPTGMGKTAWARAFAGSLGLSYGTARPNTTHSAQPSQLFSQLFHVKQDSEYQDHIDIVLQEPSPAQVWFNNLIIDTIDKNTNHIPGTGGEPFPMPVPNMIVVSGTDTRHLPKALIDRFMMKLYVNYPGVAAEKQLLQLHHTGVCTTPIPICTPETITQAKQEVQNVAVEDPIFNYIISITETTRRISAIKTGASPRASISLLMASKAYAAICGRDYVTIDDVQSLAIPVLRHRVTLRADAINEGLHADRIIEGIIVGK